MGCGGSTIVLNRCYKEQLKSRSCVLQYIDVKSTVDTVDDTLGCVCLRRFIDDEMYLRLRRKTVISEQEILSLRE